MLKSITISGADDLVYQSDLEDLSNEYPFVEWGILLSANRVGTPRYPTTQWIQQLSSHPKLNCSGHLCGGFARVIVEKGLVDHFKDHTEWDVFKRFQINFKAEEGPKRSFLDAVKSINEKQIIIQVRGINESYLRFCLEEYLDVVPLFDKSGGAGITPIDWPNCIPGVYCGFAGGLSPDNLEQEIDKILSKNKGSNIWVDLETGARTDDKFDLVKVEKCLKIAKKYMS